MTEKTEAMKRVVRESDERQGPYIDFRYYEKAKDMTWAVVLDGWFDQDDVKVIYDALKEANDED